MIERTYVTDEFGTLQIDGPDLPAPVPNPHPQSRRWKMKWNYHKSCNHRKRNYHSSRDCTCQQLTVDFKCARTATKKANPVTLSDHLEQVCTQLDCATKKTRSHIIRVLA